MEAVIHACQAFMHKLAHVANVWMLHQARKFVACNPTYRCLPDNQTASGARHQLAPCLPIGSDILCISYLLLLP
jgi:hypothetical protein